MDVCPSTSIRPHLLPRTLEKLHNPTHLFACLLLCYLGAKCLESPRRHLDLCILGSVQLSVPEGCLTQKLGPMILC